MAPAKDPETTSDYYELLGISAAASESKIRKAYRKTSLLYHPDKVKPTPETLDKFQELQTALSVLTDPVEKSKYDSGREAKLRRQAESAAMERKRRDMVDSLERNEAKVNGGVVAVNGTKRTWSDRELATKRIREENQRKKEEKEKMMAAQAKAAAVAEVVRPFPERSPNFDDNQRSIQVRWVKEGENLDIDATALVDMFPSGNVQDVLLLKDKKRRVEGRDNKVVLGTAVIIFTSMVAAKMAIANGTPHGLDSITWLTAKTSEIT